MIVADVHTLAQVPVEDECGCPTDSPSVGRYFLVKRRVTRAVNKISWLGDSSLTGADFLFKFLMLQSISSHRREAASSPLTDVLPSQKSLQAGTCS